jgi:dsRNA-specific ribonuclease
LRPESGLNLQDLVFSSENIKNLDFTSLGNDFVKVIPDIFEALFGSIFLDCGDISKTKKMILRMMKSRFINYFPVRENHRSKAISTLESKRYGKAIKLSHV